jgi:hypothetical protein
MKINKGALFAKVSITVSLIIASTGSILFDKCVFVFLDVTYPFFLSAVFNFFTLVTAAIATRWFRTNRNFLDLPLYFHVKGITNSASYMLLMYMMYDGMQIENVQVIKTMLPFFVYIFPFWVLVGFKLPYRSKKKYVANTLFFVLIASNCMMAYTLSVKQMLMIFFWILCYSLDFFIDEKLTKDSGINGITILLYSTLESLILSLAMFFIFDGVHYMEHDFTLVVSPYILLGSLLDTGFNVLLYCGTKIGDYQMSLYNVVLILSVGISRITFYPMYEFTPVNYAGMVVAFCAHFVIQYMEKKKIVDQEAENMKKSTPLVDTNAVFNQGKQEEGYSISDIIDQEEELEKRREDVIQLEDMT